MPNFFIVSTTDDHAPHLMLSQKSFQETLTDIKTKFEKLGYRHFYVFSVKALPSNHYYPGVAQLALEAHIKPDDMPNYYTLSLGHELDLLPQEQALDELQKAIDYLHKKQLQIEGRVVTPEVAQATTG